MNQIIGVVSAGGSFAIAIPQSSSERNPSDVLSSSGRNPSDVLSSSSVSEGSDIRWLAKDLGGVHGYVYLYITPSPRDSSHSLENDRGDGSQRSLRDGLRSRMTGRFLAKFVKL